MSYYGILRNGSRLAEIISRVDLAELVASEPHEAIVIKTEPHQYAGPLPLGPVRLVVGGPDPMKPEWIAVIERQPDGSWRVSDES